MTRLIYLDYAASAPMRKEAQEAEREYDRAPYAGANPNSLHTAGRLAARALDGARRDISRLLGGGFRASDVAFSSGGTENNNLALLGLAEGARRKNRSRTRVIVSAVEHDSIIEPLSLLRERGFEVEKVTPTRDGVITPEALGAMLDRDVALVSVMAANNEVGTLQPISELGSLARSCGATFYVDAAQGFVKVPLDVSLCDAVGLVGHKIGAPVGTGALVMRGRTPFRPQSLGGGQERGVRPGTQDVRGALAFAAAARASMTNMEHDARIVAERADRLVAQVCKPESGIHPTIDIPMGEGRLPGLVSLLVDGADSESLVLKLDALGFEVSAASACASGSLDASHVLTAMGIPRDRALGSLRVSFDERVPEEDLNLFANALLDVAHQIRARG